MSQGIIKNRNFVFLWVGHFISHAGDSIYSIALPWMMLEMTGSKSLTAMIAMSAYLPALIFGLYAGVVVDKYNRKRVMIVSDMGRAFLVSIIPFSIIYGFATPLLIGIITFLLQHKKLTSNGLMRINLLVLKYMTKIPKPTIVSNNLPTTMKCNNVFMIMKVHEVD